MGNFVDPDKNSDYHRARTRHRDGEGDDDDEYTYGPCESHEDDESEYDPGKEDHETWKTR